MNQLVIVLTLWLCALGFGGKEALAGYFEISGNGSYYKYDNGVMAGDPSQTISRRLGGGISYSFLENTALEVSYSDTQNTDEFSQVSGGETLKWRVNRLTRIQNVSLDLVIGFSGRRERFRPYLRGGGGYTIRETTITGTETDLASESRTPLAVQSSSTKSVTAQAGAGFKYFLVDRVALELSYTLFASELDQPVIFLNHAFAAGLRVVF